MPRAERREQGLYKNGRLWWLRTVRGPMSQSVVSLSTGTDDLRVANRVAAMVSSVSEARPNWDLLELCVARQLSLLVLYNHFAAGTLHVLREQIAAEAATDSDTDLEPFVSRWSKEHLAARVAGGELSQQQSDDYLRQIRVFLPAGVAFRRSRWTEDAIKAMMLELKNARTGEPLSGSTQRRYLAPLQLFHRFIRKRVPGLVNPFEDPDWLPANASPRSDFWDYDTVRNVLDRMSGEGRLFMALTWGSGIEEGANLALLGSHFRTTRIDRVFTAPGTKNDYRESRSIFMTEWAWQLLSPHARLITPAARLWSTINPKARGREVREALYQAQVEAKLIEAPPISNNGKKLWKAVKPHRIHDARHDYCFIRLLGLDGEPKEDLKYCSNQLGHGDEQMVMRVYAKANIAQRMKMMEIRLGQQAGRAAEAAERK